MNKSALMMAIRDHLAKISLPREKGNLISAGRLTDLRLNETGKATILLDIGHDQPNEIQILSEQIKTSLSAISELTDIQVIATRHAPSSQKGSSGNTPSPSAAPSPASHPPKAATGGHDNPLGLNDFMKPKAGSTQSVKEQRIAQNAAALTGVKKVIAIASGKGGVGKSTLTVNLAIALATKGLKVGILDADITGPSLPTLFNLSGQPKVIDGKIQPPMREGIKLMSIGLLIDPDKAVAWRGPMVMGAIRQLMHDVDWGELDILLIDTPPGTGDAHLSLIQSGKLSAAIIVTTPQDLALADVRRGLALFEQTKTPVIGLVENMAWLEMPDGTRNYLFGREGGKKMAQALNVTFLGAIPLEPAIGEANDQGTPFLSLEAESQARTVIEKIAEQIV